MFTNVINLLYILVCNSYIMLIDIINLHSLFMIDIDRRGEKLTRSPNGPKIGGLEDDVPSQMGILIFRGVSRWIFQGGGGGRGQRNAFTDKKKTIRFYTDLKIYLYHTRIHIL